jgi:hypothetical protein
MGAVKCFSPLQFFKTRNEGANIMGEDYFGDSSDSGSSLTSQILGSLTQLGSAAILSTAGPNIQSSYPYGPPVGAYNPITGTPSTAIKGSTLLIVGLLAIGGFYFLSR